MQVYPNLEASTLTIDFFLAKNESVELQITDAKGKTLKKEMLNSNQFKLVKTKRTRKHRVHVKILIKCLFN
jgi:hypothetical protein